MPTYRYRCGTCAEEFEVWQSITDPALTMHDGCGGELVKVFSAAGIVLKGSGFYKTDSRSGNGSRPESPAERSDSEKSDAEKSDTEKSDAGKSDSGKSDSGKSDTQDTKKSDSDSSKSGSSKSDKASDSSGKTSPSGKGGSST